eukprot:TRINITY_DN67292_c0_g1_i2.p1 TRINITY_DN67292_c0_g1~~TRINITY_DN67292_c0_g1_i2.p1  ORF type:complete len:958 (+),score=176.33 TRINITY_DN67292_c0_g1_i2:75-2948(+)
MNPFRVLWSRHDSLECDSEIKLRSTAGCFPSLNLFAFGDGSNVSVHRITKQVEKIMTLDGSDESRVWFSKMGQFIMISQGKSTYNIVDIEKNAVSQVKLATRSNKYDNTDLFVFRGSHNSHNTGKEKFGPTLFIGNKANQLEDVAYAENDQDSDCKVLLIDSAAEKSFTLKSCDGGLIDCILYPFQIVDENMENGIKSLWMRSTLTPGCDEVLTMRQIQTSNNDATTLPVAFQAVITSLMDRNEGANKTFWILDELLSSVGFDLQSLESGLKAVKRHWLDSCRGQLVDHMMQLQRNIVNFGMIGSVKSALYQLLCSGVRSEGIEHFFSNYMNDSKLATLLPELQDGYRQLEHMIVFLVLRPCQSLLANVSSIVGHFKRECDDESASLERNILNFERACSEWYMRGELFLDKIRERRSQHDALTLWFMKLHRQFNDPEAPIPTELSYFPLERLLTPLDTDIYNVKLPPRSAPKMFVNPYAPAPVKVDSGDKRFTKDELLRDEALLLAPDITQEFMTIDETPFRPQLEPTFKSQAYKSSIKDPKNVYERVEHKIDSVIRHINDLNPMNKSECKKEDWNLYDDNSSSWKTYKSTNRLNSSMHDTSVEASTNLPENYHSKLTLERLQQACKASMGIEQDEQSLQNIDALGDKHLARLSLEFGSITPLKESNIAPNISTKTTNDGPIKSTNIADRILSLDLDTIFDEFNECDEKENDDHGEEENTDEIIDNDSINMDTGDTIEDIENILPRNCSLFSAISKIKSAFKRIQRNVIGKQKSMSYPIHEFMLPSLSASEESNPNVSITVLHPIQTPNGVCCGIISGQERGKGLLQLYQNGKNPYAFAILPFEWLSCIEARLVTHGDTVLLIGFWWTSSNSIKISRIDLRSITFSSAGTPSNEDTLEIRNNVIKTDIINPPKPVEAHLPSTMRVYISSRARFSNDRENPLSICVSTDSWSSMVLAV